MTKDWNKRNLWNLTSKKTNGNLLDLVVKHRMQQLIWKKKSKFKIYNHYTKIDMGSVCIERDFKKNWKDITDYKRSLFYLSPLLPIVSPVLNSAIAGSWRKSKKWYKRYWAVKNSHNDKIHKGRFAKKKQFWAMSNHICNCLLWHKSHSQKISYVLCQRLGERLVNVLPVHHVHIYQFMTRWWNHHRTQIVQEWNIASHLNLPLEKDVLV